MRRMHGILLAAMVALVGACGSSDEEPPMPGMTAEEHAQMQAGDTASAMDTTDTPGSQPVHLTSEQARTLGISYATVQRQALARTIRAVGFITAAEPRMHWVAPKIGGWVEQLHVNFTGEWVREGQPLMELYSPELVTAQEELLLARNLQRSVASSTAIEARDAADTLLSSARRRLQYWDISDEQISAIEETGQVRRTLTLHSPWSGIVMEKNVLSGSAIRPGQPLYMIADLSVVWIETEFYEADLAMISEGQAAEVTVAAYPGRNFVGRIEYVYPTLEQRTRTLKARIAVRNTGNKLKPGLYATVRLEAQVADSALAVPGSAVIQTGEREIVFVVREDGMLEPRRVQLGVHTDDWVQVLAGLELGEQVVNSATFLIDSESNLGAALGAMAGHAHAGAAAGDTAKDGSE